MKKKLLKIIKILLLSILSLTVIIILSLYLTLHKKLPEGISGPEADAFAKRIEKAVNHNKYLQTDFIKWTFRNKNHYLWDLKNGKVEVKIDDVLVNLNLKNPDKSTVLKNSEEVSFDQKQSYIENAFKNFNNDSFWVVAPHKLFDDGVTRQLVTLEDNTKALLVTYSSGGTTPGDAYLWKVDQNYLPTSYQVWVSIIPVGGIEATWEDWKKTESGAYLSQKHQLLFLEIPITNLRAWNN